MPVPLSLIVPLLLGAGYGATELSKKVASERLNERNAEVFKQLQGGGTAPAAAPEVPQIAGATQPTAAPQVETPSAESPDAYAGEAEPEMRPGEMTDLPILPTSQLLSPSTAPMYPKGITHNTATGALSVQYARDTQRLDAAWMQHFQNNRQKYTDLAPLEADWKSMSETMQRTGRLPSPQVLQMLDPTRREQLSEQTYWSAVNGMANSPEIQRAFTFMAREEGMPTDEKSINDMVFQYALRAVTTDMGGYAPESVIDNVMRFWNWWRRASLTSN
jgi:hypothetical protein